MIITVSAAAGLEADASYQQLVILNVDLLALALVLVAGGLLNDPRLTLCILEALGHILGIIDIHIHAGSQTLLAQRLNAVHIILLHIIPPSVPARSSARQKVMMLTYKHGACQTIGLARSVSDFVIVLQM